MTLRHQPPTPPSASSASVLDPDLMLVLIDAFDGDQVQSRAPWKVENWPASPTHQPAFGDRCLVQRDQAGRVWVIVGDWTDPIPVPVSDLPVSVDAARTLTTAASDFSTVLLTTGSIACNGRPVIASWTATVSHTTLGNYVQTQAALDGVLVGRMAQAQAPVAGTGFMVAGQVRLEPVEGAHTFDVRIASAAGTPSASATVRTLIVKEA